MVWCGVVWCGGGGGGGGGGDEVVYAQMFARSPLGWALLARSLVQVGASLSTRSGARR